MSMHSRDKIKITLVFLLGLLVLQTVNPSNVCASESLTARHGMVVSSTPYASDIGTEVLHNGGNAVDAAVAVAYALAVTHPAAGNIGGGGFMVLYTEDGKATTIDYREEAPSAATKTMYQDENGEVITELSRKGPLASGVPGTVAGMSYALKHYGTKNLRELIEPSIALARDGFTIDSRLARSLNENRDWLSNDSATAVIFTKADRDTFQVGDRFVQPQLAETLERIARNGASAFYTGEIARQIVATMNELDGLITLNDLKNYSVEERTPITGKYHGYQIYSMPPPSSGGIAVTSILGILEPFPLDQWGFNTVKTIHVKTEAERHVYADRNYFLGDPAYVKMPVDVLTSDAYYDYLRSLITDRATPSDQVDHISWSRVDSLRSTLADHRETTHFSIVDEWGNAVSNTYTLNGSFGAGYVIRGAGIIMNNEMDDFSAKPGVPNMYGLIGAEANSVAAGKRMLSSMSPTIVTQNGEPYLIVGSPGGSTIITTTTQIIMNVIDHHMSIDSAVAVPRVHSQWLPDYIFTEPNAIAYQDSLKLVSMGYQIRTIGSIGEANCILVDPETGTLYSGADVKRGGTEAGY